MDQVRRDDEEDDAFEYNSKVAKYSPNSADETLRPLCDALTGQSRTARRH